MHVVCSMKISMKSFDLQKVQNELNKLNLEKSVEVHLILI